MGNRRTRNAKKVEAAEKEKGFPLAAMVALSCDRCPAQYTAQVGYSDIRQEDQAHRSASRKAATLLAEHLVDAHSDDIAKEDADFKKFLGTNEGPSPVVSEWDGLPFIPAGDPWPQSTHETGFAEDLEPTPEGWHEIRDGAGRRVGLVNAHVPDFPVNTPMQDAMLVQLERCWAIMLHRSKRYNEAWLNRGANGNVLEILKLSDRIKAQMWDRPHIQGDCVTDDDLDDLRDLINYALVCLTQAELGQWNSRG